MTDENRRTAAEMRRSRWPGWIWAVPVAAFVTVGWLGLQAYLHSGPDITITFPDSGGMKAGDTKVKFKGIVVGTVKDIGLSKDQSNVVATVEMDSDVKNRLREGTRFWLVGANVSLSNLSSLKGLISGPYIQMDPGPGKSTRRFKGLEQKPVLNFNGKGRRYMVRFDGAVGGLDANTPVTLRGFTIGRVIQTRLTYDPTRTMLETPVTIELDPEALGIRDKQGGGKDSRALNAVLKALIHQGLRAELSRQPLFIGPMKVSLVFDPKADPASLDMSGRYPEIPAEPSGGIGSLEKTARGVLADAHQMDLPGIARNIRQTVRHVDALVSSPKLRQSLAHLDKSLANVQKVTASTKNEIGPAIDSLKAAADAAQSAVASANSVLGGEPGARNQALPEALKELTEAARSIRVLADYLNRHPESLLKGRSGQ